MIRHSIKWIILLTCLLFLVTGCIHWPDTFILKRMTTEERYLQQLTAGLKSENWQTTSTLFLEGYHSGYETLKEQIESAWKDQDLVNLEFDILETSNMDGMILLRTEWKRTYLNKEGKPNKNAGKSDIILKPLEKNFRIITINGDSFF